MSIIFGVFDINISSLSDELHLDICYTARLKDDKNVEEEADAHQVLSVKFWFLESLILMYKQATLKMHTICNYCKVFLESIFVPIAWMTWMTEPNVHGVNINLKNISTIK